MRPPEDLRAIAALIEADPTLAPFVKELALLYDEELCAQVVFNELADLVTDLLDHEGDEMDRLEDIFAAIEHVVVTPGIDLVESVAYGFFDALSPGTSEQASAYLGPATEALLDLLDSGELDDLYLSGGDLGDDEMDDGADDAELMEQYELLLTERVRGSAPQLGGQGRFDDIDA